MDDNINDGTVRIRTNGINADQQPGADAEIINSNVNDLGRFRTLTAGTSINITQDDNTITISATGITTTLAALTDVDLTALANEELLLYNTTSNKWENKTFSTFNSQIDIEISSYLLTNVLTTNKSFLIRSNNALSQLNAGANNTYLTIDNNGAYIWSTIPAGKQNLSEMDDVSILNLVNNNFLRYNSTSTKWENQLVDTSTIPENTNLYFTFARTQQQISNNYNGKGVLLIGTGLNTFIQQTAANTSGLLLFSDTTQNTNAIWRTPVLNDISGVLITTPTDTQLLYYDGINNRWINKSVDTSTIPETPTGLYFTFARVQTQISNNFTEKGCLLIGTGVNTFTQLAPGNTANTYLKNDGAGKLVPKLEHRVTIQYTP
jgi:hypothetical protein